MPYDRIIDIPQGWRTPRVRQLADGWSGTKITVAEANSLVSDSLSDALVVATAQNLVRHLPERDQWAEAQAIDAFVKGKIRYTNEGQETIKSPGALLREIKQYGRAVGDCDDHVILWAGLHKAIGHPVRFRVISQRSDKLPNHIYGEVFIKGRGWVSDELIVKNRPLGWRIPPKEITSSVAFMAGLGDVTRGARMPNAADVFAPGGAMVLHERRLKPSKSMWVVDPFIAQGYKIKRGGALTRGPGGHISAVGQVDTIVKGASKILSFLKKKKKKVMGAAKPKCPPGYHTEMHGVDDYIQMGATATCVPDGGFDFSLKNPVVLVGGLGLVGLVLWKMFGKGLR